MHYRHQPDCCDAGDRSTPRRSWRKSPPEELGATGSSELRSSRSTRGAAGLATPFGRLTEGVVAVEAAPGKDPALLPMKVASSKTGILSTRVDLHNNRLS
jgi:hypothetical protein